MYLILAFLTIVLEVSAAISSASLNVFSLRILRRRGLGSYPRLKEPITGFLILAFISFFAYVVVKST